MIRRPLDNTYELPNGMTHMPYDEIVKAFNSYEYLSSNYMQIVDKERHMTPFVLNRAQQYMFATLWPMLAPETRLNHHRQVVVVKPRQMGATTGNVGFAGFVAGFAKGIEHTTIIHTLPVTDTISKLTKRKVEPIITGIHPDIQPAIYKESLSSSVVYSYNNVAGVARDNIYELVSANSNSIRSDTVNIWLADECFSGDTEILCSTGYKKLREVSKDDLVAQYNQDTETITFAHPLRVIKKKPTRKVYDLKLGKDDHVTVTGGHQFLLKSKSSGEYVKKELEDISFTQNWCIPILDGVSAGDIGSGHGKQAIYFRQLGEMSKEEIHFDDYVYCVTVPDGNIVIRAGHHNYIVGNCAWYRNPEELEDIVGGAMPDHGFSLSIFFSTYGDKLNDFFMKKIELAQNNPDAMDLIFIPWLLCYPEQPLGEDFDDLELSSYEESVIVPALNEYKIPRQEWGDKIMWYRRKSLNIPHMKHEFPTTLDEVVQLGKSKLLWSESAIEYQENHVEQGTQCELLSDPITKKTKAIETDVSAFKIYRNPVYGRKYICVVDPIMSQSSESDFFAMSIFDTDTLEQVATYRDKDMPIEDFAAICVAAAKLYCNALICPERNVAEAFNICVRALGYYNFWYESKQAKAKKEPGLRTTATSKMAYLDKLVLLLEQKRITLHDAKWVNELRYFEKKVKTRGDGTQYVRYAARKGKTDDCIAVLWIFAGTLDQKQIEGKKRVGFAFI